MNFDFDDDTSFDDDNNDKHFSSDDRELSNEDLIEEAALFNKSCSDENGWFELLMCKLNAIRSVSCGQCGGCNFHHVFGARTSKCLECGKVRWLTAEYDFFRRLHKPKPYLFMIYLKEKGYGFSCNLFAKLMDISPSTASEIEKKITKAVFQSLDDNHDFELVDSAALEKVFMRRSTCTPANKPARSEQKAAEEYFKQNQEKNDSQTERNTTPGDDRSEGQSRSQSAKQKDFQSTDNGLITIEDYPLGPLTDLQRRILDYISDEPQQFDSLVQSLKLTAAEIGAALTVLELNGLITELAGQQFIRSNQNKKTKMVQSTMGLSDRTELFIEESIKFIKQHFQGVSRKYIQFYLLDFWRVTEKRSGRKTISVFEACLEYQEVTMSEIKAYISPLHLKVFAPFSSS